MLFRCFLGSRRFFVRIAVAIILSLTALAAPAALTPRIEAPRTMAALATTDTARLSRVVIKFREGSGVRWRQQALVTDSLLFQPTSALPTPTEIGAELSRVAALVSAHALSLRPLFRLAEGTLTNLKRQGEQRSNQQLADLNLYFELPLPPGFALSSLQQLLQQLNALRVVEIAYARPKSGLATLPATYIAPADAVSSATPDLSDRQGYHTNAPWGVDAAYATTISGGRGAGVKIVDIEGGWLTTHEDLPRFFYTGGTQIDDPAWRAHGTAVLGEIGSKDNGFGTTGIVPDAQLGYESIGNQDESAAIANAASVVGVGGVVLIELHAPGPSNGSPCTCNTSQCDYVAIEYWQAEFDAIKTATANGVIVVEAAGNGSSNLDDAAYGGAFNRSTRDSGAILVAASEYNRRQPACFTNHGSRIDVHGWGWSVATTGYGDLFNGGSEPRYYTHSFSGTSSAAPIVTGAAAALQGVSLAQRGRTLTPSELRSVLVSTGSAQEIELDRRIGPLPDLRAGIKSVLGQSSFVCHQFTSSVVDHVGGGRAYAQTYGSITYYYASGSNDSLGSTGSTQYTLKETSAGYFAKGACPARTDGPFPPWINSHVLSGGSGSITISGTASDPEGDLSRVELEFDGSGTWIAASGTASWSLTKSDLPSGTHSYRVRAIDTGGRKSPTPPAVSFNVQQTVACVTAPNLTHIGAGRAHQCTIYFTTHACANGSNQDLGFAAIWSNPTTSIKETSPGYWIKVSSCN